MSRLLYEVANDIAPEDPCEVTIVLTQAQLYHSGSYQKPYATRNDGRALVDMCVQLSTVALALVTVGFGTETILNPREREVNQVFKAAKTTLISQRPERAADILESIPAGTPNILNAERCAIFEDAMIARARQRTHSGLYAQALADLSRVRAQSPLAAEATRLAIECRNLQAIALDTNTRTTPVAEFLKTDADNRQIAGMEASAASPTLSTNLASAPVYPVPPYKAFPTSTRESKGETKVVATSTAPAPLQSHLPPQLLPQSGAPSDTQSSAPPSEGTSYWMQESSTSGSEATEEPAAITPDTDPVPAKEIIPSEEAPAPVKREWKTAPSGKTKFADN